MNQRHLSELRSPSRQQAGVNTNETSSSSAAGDGDTSSLTPGKSCQVISDQDFYLFRFCQASARLELNRAGPAEANPCSADNLSSIGDTSSFRGFTSVYLQSAPQRIKVYCRRSICRTHLPLSLFRERATRAELAERLSADGSGVFVPLRF